MSNLLRAAIVQQAANTAILPGGGAVTLPVVTTNPVVVNATDVSAESGGNVTSSGNATVTARGVCWSTSSNPDITDSKTIDGSGVGAFTSLMTGLSPSTIYYIRAYATNSEGTSYGSQIMFQTEEAVIQNTLLNSLVSIWEFDELSGDAVDKHGNHTGQVSGNVTRNRPGPGTLKAYGFAPNDPKVTIPSTALLRSPEFSVGVWVKMNLPTGTDRHSIITGAGGSGYNTGWRLTFDKYNNGRVLFESGDGNPTNPTRYSAVAQDLSGLFGNWMRVLTTFKNGTAKLYINNVLRATVNNVVVGYDSGNADLYPMRVGEAGGVTDFVGDITQPIYYAREVTPTEENDLWNDGNGLAYPNFGSTAPTITTPTVTTNSPTNIATTGATVGGNVTSDGGAEVIARGVVYGLTSNPTLANNYVDLGGGTGSFSTGLTGLDTGTIYYVRAYATNSQGTAYGNQVQFSTEATSGGDTGEPPHTGTTYYFSATGNNANSGLTSGSPKQTIAAANGLSLSPGDAILFKRGDSFEGNLVISNSGNSANRVVIGGYGEGNKPKILGSRVLSGWTSYGAGIYRKAYATEPSQLFVNGQKMRLARLQNTGVFSFITAVGSTTQFTSNQINGSINHVGAVCYVRTGYYQTSIRTVTGQSGQTLTLNASAALRVDNGFILMGKLDYLTAAGEWVYSGGYVYLRTLNNDNPDNYTVRISVDNYGISINSRSYINVIGVEIAHQKLWGIHASGGSNHLIENNYFLYNEEVGYRNVGGHTDLVIRGNNFKGQNGLGIYNYHGVRELIEENVFRDIGVFNEIGKLGHGEKDTWGSGFEISQPNNPYVDPDGLGYVFRYNDFYNMCYNGFFWRGKATVWRNFFDGMSINKQDGGGIYTNTQGNGSVISENIILNCIGQIYGYWTGRAFAKGIYPDENCEYVLCEHNTILNSGEAGIKVHNNRTSILRYNHIVDARTTIDVLGRVDNSGSLKVDINNNVLVQNYKDDQDGYLTSNLFMWLHNSPTQGSGSPQITSNNNKFVYPHTANMFRTTDNVYRTFASWQGLGYDANSTLSQTALLTGEKYQGFFNKSKVTKTYNVTGNNVKGVDQQAVTQVTLLPYRSVILRGTNIQLTEV